VKKNITNQPLSCKQCHYYFKHAIQHSYDKSRLFNWISILIKKCLSLSNWFE